VTFLPSLWVAAPGATDLQNGLVLFFALLIGHAFADYPLQGQFLSVGKVRGDALEKLTGTKWPQGVWLYLLSMHSLVHAGAVWMITADVRFGLAEFFLHWIIDFAKAEDMTNFYVDQALHIACKIVFVYLIIM
jgi:hypothetical protein